MKNATCHLAVGFLLLFLALAILAVWEYHSLVIVSVASDNLDFIDLPKYEFAIKLPEQARDISIIQHKEILNGHEHDMVAYADFAIALPAFVAWTVTSQ